MEEAQKMLKHTKLSIIIKKKKKKEEREKKLGNMEFVITYLHCTTNMGCLKKYWKERNITAQLKKKPIKRTCHAGSEFYDDDNIDNLRCMFVTRPVQANSLQDRVLGGDSDTARNTA